MNKVNLFAIAYALGVICGVLLIVAENSCRHTKAEPQELQQQLVAVHEDLVAIQEEFLRFYINDYCEETARAMNVKAFNVMWVGMYCDKDKVMLLSDDAPHLPIGTISMSLEITP